MKLKVNGEEKCLKLSCESINLSELIKTLGYKENTIVVELNNIIINSDDWTIKPISDGDKLEIVSIVGGG